MESVWSYPRPPRLEPVAQQIRVVLGGETVVDTTDAYRVLETSHPPGYYIPPGDVRAGCLVRAGRGSFCEWKGSAHYFDVCGGGQIVTGGAWGYDHPSARFASIAGFISFYAGRMDACFLGSERVEPQEGEFYGGWITRDLAGPFKGGPGSTGW